MSTTAILESSSIQLEPGSDAYVPLTVRNDSAIVEEYSFDVVGPAAAWSAVEPPVVSVYPGQSTTAMLAFHPPREATVQVGQLSYAVRVLPAEHPEESVVPEGTVEILPFYETTAELLPRTSRGRGGAHHRLAVDNRGNTPITVQLSGSDNQDALSFETRPRYLDVTPGTAAFADVKVHPVRRIWRGESATHPFVVSVAAPSGPPVVLDGTYLQEAFLPRWFLKALLLALALAALLAALWFLLLKPAVESTAKEAVAGPVAQAQQQAADAGQKAGGAAALAGEAKKAAEDASGSAIAPPAPPTSTSAPFSRRLEVATATPADPVKSDSLTVPASSTMKLTDVVMSNPQGDFGRLVLLIASDGNPPRYLFDMALENFRDVDYHFVTPIEIQAGQSLRLTITCNKVGTPPNAPAPATCDAAALLGGTVLTVP